MAIIEYKCPRCGGALVFDSGKQKMVCPFCDSEFEVEAIKQHDENLKSAKEDGVKWDKAPETSEWKKGELEGMILYTCTSCGGEIVGDESTVAKQCPYCGNTAIIRNQVEGMLRPDMVIPFMISKKQAKSALLKFYEKKPLLPASFKSKSQIDSITGIYAPFWLYSCDASASLQYRGTQSTFWSDTRYNYTKTDTYDLFRDGEMRFSHVPADGSSKLDDRFMEAIEPFDYREAVDFTTAYLAGFLADKYDVDAESCKPRIDERIRNSAIDSFASTVVQYSAVMTRCGVSAENTSVKYALLPVWLLNAKYGGKIYSFAMNGQTGKFIGELPVHWGKFWGMLLGIFAGLSAVGCLIASLF
ncbi:MAG: hypothetical protein LBT59_10105 [Clostridiales bacterium]|jgi:DNA-directed RNA polymerase subunit RPC12/RpoP|nr:hypothetical protein [Clostridiales bacterium]